MMQMEPPKMKIADLISYHEMAIAAANKNIQASNDFRTHARNKTGIQVLEETLKVLRAAKDIDVLIKDPETGLVPCGGKGKAILLTDRTRDAVKYAVACEECFIGLPFAFDDPEAAKRAWNRARGYREDEEE